MNKEQNDLMKRILELKAKDPQTADKMLESFKAVNEACRNLK